MNRGSRQDDEDAAAVITLIAALSRPSQPPKPTARTFWTNRAPAVTPRTPGAWWASGLPR